MNDVDLSTTIAPKSDQLNADDLVAGPRTVTIRAVKKSEGGANDQPIAVYYEGDGNKPYKPCKSMRRLMVMAWGPKGADYVGRSMTLFREPTVKFGGIEVGGIRISHMSHISGRITVALTASKSQRLPYTVEKLEADPLPALRERAKLAAQQGTTTFRGFWNEADVKPHWDRLREHLEDYKRIASEADQRGAPTDPDPFSAEPREREPGEEG